MIELFEQYGYKRSGFLDHIDDDSCKEIQRKLASIEECGFKKTVKRYNEDALCLNIDYDKNKNKFHFETSYFVGIDWVIEAKQAIYVQPKLNKGETQIDLLKILFEALQEPENFNHLDGLLAIDFNKPPIKIKQELDILSPFLLVQFLQILKCIVRKGLKKSYYKVTNNLEAKVKGKILINRTLKESVLKNKLTKTVCQYEEFEINSEENKILKKALSFVLKTILDYKGLDNNQLQHIINYVLPAFETVSDDIDINKIKAFKPNPIYKEYEVGLKLAVLILKRYSYNIHNTETNQYVTTPPFWIDMSRLFELYVFKKFRDIFPKYGELTYHLKTAHQELDFLLNHTNGENTLKMVIDAKYKPRYETGNISTDDARQVSGYARLKSIYEKLDVEKDRLIDCLIIYSDTSENLELKKDDLTSNGNGPYQNLYKKGIGLPRITNDLVL